MVGAGARPGGKRDALEYNGVGKGETRGHLLVEVDQGRFVV